MSDDAHEMQEELDARIPELKGSKISGLVALTKLKKMHQEKPWLYEEEEHAVLKLAEDAIEFIKQYSEGNGTTVDARTFLEEHK